MIFVTVGSMFAFDRLVRAMDEHVAAGRIHGPVFAQIGAGAYLGRYLSATSTYYGDPSTPAAFFASAKAMLTKGGRRS